MRNNLVFVDFIKNKINLLFIVVSFIGAYLLFPNYLFLSVNPLALSKELWYSLDPSWVVALNYVKEKGVSWGSDFAFTYGPLGQLLTRAAWGENKYVFLAFDIFIFINYFLLFFISLAKSNYKIITALTIPIVCMISPLWVGSSNSLVLMTFLVFWINLSIDNKKWVYYIFQILIIIILFYSKFNTGLIALPIFYSGIIYNFITDKSDKIKLTVIALLPILLIFTLSFLFNVDLINYVKSGLEIVKGYNDIMYLKNQLEGSYTTALVLIILLSIVFLINIYFINKYTILKSTVLFFLFFISIFVIYKQAFVRADVSHIRDFFVFLPLIIFTNKDLLTKARNLFSTISVLLIVFFSLFYFYKNFDQSFNLAQKFDKSEYSNGFTNFDKEIGLNIYKDNFPLPIEILQKIGNSTVDIFPWNIQLLLENKLNYLPRPVIQSYTAYTPYLQDLNFDHYNSNEGPEFVIYDYASIDERYPLFDESKVNLSLIKNYKIVSSFEYDNRNMLLLQRKNNFSPLVFIKQKEYAMYLNSPLIIKDDVFYELSIYNNLMGEIKSKIFYAPEINIEIKNEQGQFVKFRSSKLLLESGLFSTFFVNGTTDFSNLMKTQSSNNKIKSIYIRPLDIDLFKEKIKITEYKISQ
ncbi:MAG: hypothetical protein EKK56_03845 [Flavobacteriaceae bacterium]|nr:MAG: hypothetical protein EKK56_03845 [Flavobacteriaceae bacterium]